MDCWHAKPKLFGARRADAALPIVCELAPKVRALCERYGQHYNAGTFVRQLTSVAHSLIANAIPPRLAVASRS